jgi:hypothetical protein
MVGDALLWMCNQFWSVPLFISSSVLEALELLVRSACCWHQVMTGGGLRQHNSGSSLYVNGAVHFNELVLTRMACCTVLTCRPGAQLLSGLHGSGLPGPLQGDSGVVIICHSLADAVSPYVATRGST